MPFFWWWLRPPTTLPWMWWFFTVTSTASWGHVLYSLWDYSWCVSTPAPPALLHQSIWTQQDYGMAPGECTELGVDWSATPLAWHVSLSCHGWYVLTVSQLSLLLHSWTDCHPMQSFIYYGTAFGKTPKEDDAARRADLLLISVCLASHGARDYWLSLLLTVLPHVFTFATEHVPVSSGHLCYLLT